MDSRKALSEGTILHFSGMSCVIRGEIGRGSNAIVYRCSYADAVDPEQYHHVIIKELFPLHKQGKIFRQEDGSIHVDPEGQETFQIHKHSFETGNKAHLALLEACPSDVGANINTYPLNSTLYTVLGLSGGSSLESLQKTPARSLRSCAVRMLCILDALEVFHENGIAHLDIAPDNIILIGNGNRERALLIDYNSTIPVGLNFHADSVVFSVKQGYTAPEVQDGLLQSIGFASDMFSVTAVFYRLISGQAVTNFQVNMRTAPVDILSAPCVQNEPDTVQFWLQTIIAKGLRFVAEKRYQNTAQMRKDLQELLDRIDGIGLTHCALWESGRRQIEKMVRDNPSLSFIKNSAELFPSMVTDGQKVYPSSEYIRNSSKNILLLAGGGMGKTTALLRLAFSGNARYSPDQTAVIYLPLYGWQPDDKSYIVNSILESLHFRTENHSFEEARKALYELLLRPIETRNVSRPVLLLLLDGLNELSGDTKPLIDEIIRLSAMRGVRILVSGRADETALPFERVHLSELTEETVQQNLSKEGLTYPDSEDMRKALKIPLMLSMYLSSGRITGRQIRINSISELLKAYVEALKDKVLREIPDETERRWQIEAAVDFVLPAISAEIHKHNRALEDRELLPVVAKCFSVINGPLSRRFFPNWIGHTAAIRGNAKNAEEWYGQIVHALLWKNLGLIIRDRMGRYIVSHQTIEEYLLGLEKENRRKIRSYHSVVAALAAVFFACFGGISLFVYNRFVIPQPYNEIYADNVMEHSLNAYVAAGTQYELLSDLTDCAIDTPQNFQQQLNFYKHTTPYLAMSGQEAVQSLNDMMKTGEVMPWSQKPIDQAACKELLTLAEDREEEYKFWGAVLEFVMTDDYAKRHYSSQYPQLLKQLLEIDAQIACKLFKIVCYPHMTSKYADNSLTANNFNKLLMSVSKQNVYLSLSKDESIDQARLTLTTLKGNRNDCISGKSKAGEVSLGSCGIIDRFKKMQRVTNNS